MTRLRIYPLLFVLLLGATPASATYITFSKPFEDPVNGVVHELTKEEISILVTQKLGHKPGEEELDVSKKTHKVDKRIFFRGEVKSIDGISVDLWEKLSDYSMFFKVRTLYSEQKFIFQSGVGWFSQIIVAAILLTGLMGFMPATLYLSAKLFNKTGEVSIADAYITHSLLLLLSIGAVLLEAWLIQGFSFFQDDTGLLVYTFLFLACCLVIVIIRSSSSYGESVASFIGWFLGVPLTLWLITLSQPKLLDLIDKT